MLSSENFIYFFTVCGFFIGIIFSIFNFINPEDIIIYTTEITLFFYLFIHVIIMNFIDIKKFGNSLFDKQEYEDVSEYFIGELDTREKKMDSLLLGIEKMNVQYEKELEKSAILQGVKDKKAA